MPTVLYTQDSIVTSYDITKLQLVKNSIFTFRSNWHSKFLCINNTFTSYFCITTENRVLVYADELPLGVLFNLYLFLNSTKNWLLEFKLWFLKITDARLFITNKQRLYLTDKTIESVTDVSLKMTNINKEYYWRKLLPYISTLKEV